MVVVPGEFDDKARLSVDKVFVLFFLANKVLAREVSNGTLLLQPLRLMHSGKSVVCTESIILLVSFYITLGSQSISGKSENEDGESTKNWNEKREKNRFHIKSAFAYDYRWICLGLALEQIFYAC